MSTARSTAANTPTWSSSIAEGFAVAEDRNGATGGLDDKVRLYLTSPVDSTVKELLLAEAWEVQESILAQPATWSIRVGLSGAISVPNPGAGHANLGSIAAMFTANPAIYAGQGYPMYPKGSKYELYVGGNLQMTGVIEAFEMTGAASTITIKGRDALAPLYLAHSEVEKSFINGTYAQLVQWALQQVGIDPAKLIYSNLANRQVKAGIPIKELEAATDSADESVTSNAGAVVRQEHQYKCGESILRFLRRHLDRAGLFLWATADGHFVLSQPNGAQQPAYALLRIRKGPGHAESSNIVNYHYSDDAMHRHSEVTIYGRGGGRNVGRSKAHGGVVDEEMDNLGFSQPLILRDANVQNTEQCEFFARRKLAEERRNGWSLSYQISGHTLKQPSGGKPAVLTPDTVIYVQDDEIGIKGNYYIETVRRERDPHTTTTIRLMRIGDLIFGTGGGEDVSVT